ncbi:MAG: HAMP domain-containing sensor histidine kinase [Pseudomonadota bacterium]
MIGKMPNRADHSVKTPRRDQGTAIKNWAIFGGVSVAVIGALSVMIAGGPTGTLFGASLLTTIIFLQIFLRFMPVRESKPTENSVGGHGFQQIKTDRLNDAPVLILSVSPLGRVRSIVGRDSLLPGIRLGADVAPDLDQASGVSVTRIPSNDGGWIIVLPQSAELDADELRERTNFFAGLGHDLKSPLNAVIGFAEIMEAEIRGPLPEVYQDYPGLIKESGETLLRLVEDMLAYAKSEAGTYELDLAPMDVAASGESVLRQSQAVADKAEVLLKLAMHGEVIAMADADAVRRIWDNLVSNAIKYSSPGDTVTLSASARGNQTRLQVTDTGAGMNADDLARIARPFAQGRNSKGRAGTGLGLAMVQRLAEMQGGQVEIRTAPGAGTTVIVTLPAHLADSQRAAE